MVYNIYGKMVDFMVNLLQTFITNMVDLLQTLSKNGYSLYSLCPVDINHARAIREEQLTDWIKRDVYVQSIE